MQLTAEQFEMLTAVFFRYMCSYDASATFPFLYISNIINSSCASDMLLSVHQRKLHGLAAGLVTFRTNPWCEQPAEELPE